LASQTCASLCRDGLNAAQVFHAARRKPVCQGFGIPQRAAAVHFCLWQMATYQELLDLRSAVFYATIAPHAGPGQDCTLWKRIEGIKVHASVVLKLDVAAGLKRAVEITIGVIYVSRCRCAGQIRKTPATKLFGYSDRRPVYLACHQADGAGAVGNEIEPR